MARPGMTGYGYSFHVELDGKTVRVIIELADVSESALLYEHLYDHVVKGQLKLELYKNTEH